MGSFLFGLFIINVKNESSIYFEHCNYNFSIINVCCLVNSRHKILHTIPQHQVKHISNESEGYNGGVSRKEEIINGERIDRSRTVSSKNSFY